MHNSLQDNAGFIYCNIRQKCRKVKEIKAFPASFVKRPTGKHAMNIFSVYIHKKEPRLPVDNGDLI